MKQIVFLKNSFSVDYEYFCGTMKLEDSGVDQLSVAMKQWTGSVSADCGARPWVEREPQAE